MTIDEAEAIVSGKQANRHTAYLTAVHTLATAWVDPDGELAGLRKQSAGLPHSCHRACPRPACMVRRERDDLKAEVERLTGLMSGDPEIIHLESTRAGFDCQMEHWAVKLMASSMWDSFKQSDAPNYLVMELGGTGDGVMEVTLRPKWKGRTPGDDVRDLKAEVANLKTLLDARPTENGESKR